MRDTAASYDRGTAGGQQLAGGRIIEELYTLVASDLDDCFGRRF